jgi:alpha-ribazole phosphatase
MAESTTLWLIRHGLTEGGDGRCCGRFDVPLSSGGVEQASTIAKRLASEPISKMYSSDLSRAIETARIVVEPHGLAVQTLSDLSEMNFGDLEGLPIDEIKERYPAVFHSWMTTPAKTRFPNGESFMQMTARVLAVLDWLVTQHSKQTIAIVAHAGVNRLILAKALSIPDDQIFRLAQDYGAINRIKYFEHGPVVELMNG